MDRIRAEQIGFRSEGQNIIIEFKIPHWEREKALNVLSLPEVKRWLTIESMLDDEWKAPFYVGSVLFADGKIQSHSTWRPGGDADVIETISSKDAGGG